MLAILKHFLSFQYLILGLFQRTSIYNNKEFSVTSLKGGLTNILKEDIGINSAV